MAFPDYVHAFTRVPVHSIWALDSGPGAVLLAPGYRCLVSSPPPLTWSVHTYPAALIMDGKIARARRFPRAAPGPHHPLPALPPQAEWHSKVISLIASSYAQSPPVSVAVIACLGSVASSLGLCGPHFRDDESIPLRLRRDATDDAWLSEHVYDHCIRPGRHLPIALARVANCRRRTRARTRVCISLQFRGGTRRNSAARVPLFVRRR